MSRKSRRVVIDLDAKGLKEIPEAELNAVLRGADEIIGRGGRTLLTRILRGSRIKKVLEHKLDQSPVYGYFHNLSDDATLARIDWAILHGYLRIEYSNRLPVVVFTQKGWEILAHQNFARFANKKSARTQTGSVTRVRLLPQFIR